VIVEVGREVWVSLDMIGVELGMLNGSNSSYSTLLHTLIKTLYLSRILNLALSFSLVLSHPVAIDRPLAAFPVMSIHDNGNYGSVGAVMTDTKDTYINRNPFASSEK
jgi:hypothetical protein